LLVADLSGRALIRLGHAGSDDDARTQGRETAERVSLVGSPQGRALAEQTLVVQDTIEGARVFAPGHQSRGGDRRARADAGRGAG
jgi:hypothetical protein